MTGNTGAVTEIAELRRPRLRWPGITLREIQNPELGECLEFELSMSYSQVTGAVDVQGRYVSFPLPG
ncbi:hypothetical protein F0U60_16160 [Archangium minus]|uniref:Uncharacterized protein n=1 Tax=Archangium minus TaxID=83450 RepID=A0ABY9WRN1_9BACT|nr:hypothetical protein F0U60_16160 [Archangium minus]